jgi:hypothetical protein
MRSNSNVPAMEVKSPYNCPRTAGQQMIKKYLNTKLPCILRISAKEPNEDAERKTSLSGHPVHIF